MTSKDQQQAEGDKDLVVRLFLKEKKEDQEQQQVAGVHVLNPEPFQYAPQKPCDIGR